MALQTIRIGSAVDIYQYDDADFDSGIEASAPISAAAPVNADEVLRLGDIGVTIGDVFGPGASTDHAVARWDGVGGYTLLDSSLIVLDDGSLGIGTIPTHHIHSVHADTSTVSVQTLYTNHSFSGNHPGGGDIIQVGHYLGVSSTVIGAQTAGDRHTLRAVEINSVIDASGNSYGQIGLYIDLAHTHTTDMNTLAAIVNHSEWRSTGTLVYHYSVRNEVLNTGGGTISNAYGDSCIVTNSGAGTIGIAIGVRSEVIQSAGTLTTAYLFYGIFSGTIGTAWGIYLSGCTLNYLDGRLGVNIVAPAAQVHIDQSDNGAAIPVLSLDQADTSDGFINFIGSDRGVITGATNSLESVRVEINGAVRRLALYVDA